MIKQLQSAYHNWIFNAYPAQSDQLSLYRVLYTTIIIVLVGIPKYTDRIARFPDGIYNPPPFFSSIFSGMPDLMYFQITDVIIAVGFFMVLVGFFTRSSGVITSLLIIINNGFIFSSGKIDHSLMVWFTLFLMSFSGWGRHLSLDSVYFGESRSKLNNWTISLLSMALGFGFFTAGLIKLVSGWLSFSDSMLRAFYLRNFYVQQKQDYLSPIFENFNFFPFWESGDWFTIIFEIGFLLVIFNPILFRFFTALAVFFHGLILLMMNIAFAHYLAIYIAFWVPLFSKRFTDMCIQYFEKVNRNVFSTLLFYSGLLILYLLINQMPGIMKVWLRDGFLIVAFIFVLYTLLIKPRLLFVSSNDKEGNDIIKFDGVCNLCNGFVQFVLERDKNNQFKFSTLQRNEVDNPIYNSIELHHARGSQTQSSAFLSIVRRLKGFWPYLYLGIIIPKPLREMIYDWVSRNRYNWFGKRTSCMIPSDENADRFI